MLDDDDDATKTTRKKRGSSRENFAPLESQSKVSGVELDANSLLASPFGPGFESNLLNNPAARAGQQLISLTSFPPLSLESASLRPHQISSCFRLIYSNYPARFCLQ